MQESEQFCQASSSSEFILLDRMNSLSFNVKSNASRFAQAPKQMNLAPISTPAMSHGRARSHSTLRGVLGAHLMLGVEFWLSWGESPHSTVTRSFFLGWLEISGVALCCDGLGRPARCVFLR